MTKQSPTHHIIKILSLSFIAFVISCGNWGWESIETDNEEQLNIFGLISLDTTLQSFVVVHKTLDTSGPDEEVIGHDTIFFEAWQWINEDTGLMERDTFWYDPPYVRTIYESKYIVKDATVTISDGQNDYSFIRSPQDPRTSEYWRYGGEILFDPAIYLNTDNSFIPQPDTEYTLSVTTPGGHDLTGSTTTPGIPEIHEGQLADTLSIRNLFELKWTHNGDYYTSVATGQSGDLWEYYICGIDQQGLVEPGDTTWTSSVDSWCLNDIPDEGALAEMGIRVRYVDENYYRYFLATDEDTEEISNFLVGEGSIGTAFGVEGGFGVFGSLSADWSERYVRP